MSSTLFSEWEAGDLSSEYTLRELCRALADVEREIASVEVARSELRDQISRVLARVGDKAEIAGFGKVLITAPSVSRSYDTKRLDALIIQLTADGFSPIAQQIAQAAKETARAGGLRIEREKNR